MSYAQVIPHPKVHDKFSSKILFFFTSRKIAGLGKMNLSMLWLSKQRLFPVLYVDLFLKDFVHNFNGDDYVTYRYHVIVRVIQILKLLCRSFSLYA